MTAKRAISTLKTINKKKLLQNIDIVIWIAPLLLVHLSCFLIASTQRNLGTTDWYQHAIISYIGSLIIYVLAQVPLQSLKKLIFPIYSFTMLILLYVNVSGTSALGAQRWLSIAGFNVQPSEFAKLIAILVIAAVLDGHQIRQPVQLFKPLSVILLPWLLVFIQPDLGTS